MEGAEVVSGVAGDVAEGRDGSHHLLTSDAEEVCFQGREYGDEQVDVVDP